MKYTLKTRRMHSGLYSSTVYSPDGIVASYATHSTRSRAYRYARSMRDAFNNLLRQKREGQWHDAGDIQGHA